MPQRTAASAVRRGLTFWRRSIQARVVASTVLLSSLVLIGVGWFLLHQTRDGLLDHRLQAVLGEATAETKDARNRLEAVPGTDQDASQQRLELVDPIRERAKVRGYAVALARPGPSLTSHEVISSSAIELRSIPRSLQRHFLTSSETAWTYTRLYRSDGTSSPAVAVGSSVRLPADGATYTLYYLFPLEDEEQTLGLVTRALSAAAGVLLILVAGLTWLVTRQVVAPIRLARRIAERLAAGQLQERLVVKGEDDLARLATSFNQMASNLQRQIRQLEELSRVQRRFVSDVSHELRTPLTTVRMASDIIHDARTDLDPVTARAAELLQTELDRFETLLTDLLEISRFDAGAAVLETEDVNLADVVNRVVESTQVLADQRGVRLVVRTCPTPCLAEADVRRVDRIVRNLVTNAIDHAESGDVVIEVAGDDQATAITVRDFGVGLGPGESALVFNRFWRADPARARTSGGTGLGLSIALEDTHLHGGWLQAWGRPGEGSQFRLTLPRRSGLTLKQSPLPLVPSDTQETV